MSATARVTPTLPYLWVTDIIAAQPLAAPGLFAEIFSPEVPGNEPGHHILSLDPDTPELVWKTIAYELINQGCQVSVCQLGTVSLQPLQWYLEDGKDGAPAQEVAMHIAGHNIDWQDWVKGLDTPLDLEAALDLAKLALSKIKEDKKQAVELDRLRRRCGMSEYSWDKKYLEPLRAKLERALALPDTPTTNRTRSSRYKQRYQAVKELWGSRLRLNTLKQRVELDGEPLDLDFVRADLCITLDIDIPKEEAVEIVLTIARENQYCPIVEYLERVAAAYPNPNIDFDKLAPWLLGTSDRLYSAYLKRHLIGSVARAFNPGCQMDTALILQGDQGVGKSSFFRTLYGAEFFDDTMAEASDKDELMKLHQHWAVEWAEFETQLSRKGYSKLKQFMTTKVDTYRAPYGRTPKTYPRRSILVGSTNELEFLNDPSGDRRYWVVPIGGEIDLSLTEELRDQIWAAAVAAYRAGEQWWLTPGEKQLADEANKPFRTSDTWEDFILTYVQERQFVTIAEVLGQGLNIESSKQDKGSQMRASAILRRLGWDKGKAWINGTWKRGWVNPDRSTDPPFDGVDREFNEVDRCQESNKINASSYTDPPDPPFNQHLPESSSLIMEVTEAKTEKSLVEGGSGGSEKSPEACQIEVSPTDPPLADVSVGQWVKTHHPVSGKEQVVQITKLANQHGLYLYKDEKGFSGTLFRNQFEPLSKNEVCRLGLK